MMKILYLSFTAPGTRYLAVLRDTLQSLVSPQTEVDVVGLNPPNGFVHRLSEWRCTYQLIAENVDAADRGYDAVVIGHFQDSGLHELRSVLDIPVVGLGEAAIHQALQLGDRFGLVTINPGFIEFHRRQVHGYHLDAKFAGVRAIETDQNTFQAAFDGQLAEVERVADEFKKAASMLVADGADVIIPAGGFPALLLWSHDRIPDLGDAVVLDPLGIAIGQAEMWARLGPGRLRPARGGSFAKPPAGVIEEIRASLSMR